MKTFESELDEILSKYGDYAVLKDENRFDDTQMAREFPGELSLSEAKDALLTAVQAMGERVIGNDEEFWTDHFGDYHNVPTDLMRSRNDLRAEQRTRLSQELGKENTV